MPGTTERVRTQERRCERELGLHMCQRHLPACQGLYPKPPVVARECALRQHQRAVPPCPPPSRPKRHSTAQCQRWADGQREPHGLDGEVLTCGDAHPTHGGQRDCEKRQRPVHGTPGFCAGIGIDMHEAHRAGMAFGLCRVSSIGCSRHPVPDPMVHIRKSTFNRIPDIPRPARSAKPTAPPRFDGLQVGDRQTHQHGLGAHDIVKIAGLTSQLHGH